MMEKHRIHEIRPQAIIRCRPPEITEVFRKGRLRERRIRLGVITSD